MQTLRVISVEMYTFISCHNDCICVINVPDSIITKPSYDSSKSCSCFVIEIKGGSWSWPQVIGCGLSGVQSWFLQLAELRCVETCCWEKGLYLEWRLSPRRCLGCGHKGKRGGACKEPQIMKTRKDPTRTEKQRCGCHLNLTLFSMLLASSWVTPIRDSLLMAMSWSPGRRRPSWTERKAFKSGWRWTQSMRFSSIRCSESLSSQTCLIGGVLAEAFRQSSAY